MYGVAVREIIRISLKLVDLYLDGLLIVELDFKFKWIKKKVYGQLLLSFNNYLLHNNIFDFLSFSLL